MTRVPAVRRHRRAIPTPPATRTPPAVGAPAASPAAAAGRPARGVAASKTATALGALAAVAALGLLPRQAGAQSHLFSFRGWQSYDRVGHAVAPAGDVDRDGVPDLLIGSPATPSPRPQVRVHSGRTGMALHELRGKDTDDGFGIALAGVGDVDGDGHADFAIGAHLGRDPQSVATGYVQLFSGRTGQVLRTFYGKTKDDLFGNAIADVGDMDRDGVRDLAIGAYRPGYVQVLSLRSYQVLHEVAKAPGIYFGFAVAGAGDVNGDSYPDLLVGAYAIRGFGYSGEAYVYSGRDAQLLQTVTADGNDYFGIAVSGLGDVNTDGYDDYAVGGSASNYNAGVVKVISGASGKPLYALRGAHDNHYFGRALARAGDVDGDGAPDLLIGMPGDKTNASRAGAVRVCAGPDGHELFTVHGTSRDEEFGGAVAAAGDVDADGHADVCGGGKGYANDAGRVRVFAGTVLTLTTDTHTVRLATGGSQRMELDAGAAFAGRGYLVLGSASGTGPGLALGGVRLPLNADGWFFFTLGSPNTAPLSGSSGVLDGNGRATCWFMLPPGLHPALHGTTLHHAALVYAGRSLLLATNARPVTLD